MRRLWQLDRQRRTFAFVNKAGAAFGFTGASTVFGALPDSGGSSSFTNAGVVEISTSPSYSDYLDAAFTSTSTGTPFGGGGRLLLDDGPAFGQLS